jgi:hypothetical protein
VILIEVSRHAMAMLCVFHVEGFVRDYLPAHWNVQGQENQVISIKAFHNTLIKWRNNKELTYK